MMASSTAHHLAAHGKMSESDKASLAATVAIVSVVLLLGVYFGVLKLCYGSFSLRTVLREYKEKKSLEDVYETTFQRRQEIIYHRDWAKSRGDFTEARQLDVELVRVEAELDALDDKLGSMVGGETKFQ